MLDGDGDAAQCGGESATKVFEEPGPMGIIFKDYNLTWHGSFQYSDAQQHSSSATARFDTASCGRFDRLVAAVAQIRRIVVKCRACLLALVAPNTPIFTRTTLLAFPKGTFSTFSPSSPETSAGCWSGSPMKRLRPSQLPAS